MTKLFGTTSAVAPAQAPKTEEAATRGGLSGMEELLGSLRAAISRIDSLAHERGRLLASISETEHKIADREGELVTAKARVLAEQMDLALTSEEPLESEKAAELLARQVSFLNARVQGLRGKLEGPNGELAVAREELQGLWAQVRERQLDQSIADFHAAAAQMKRVTLQALGLFEGFGRSAQDRVSARWQTAMNVLFDTVVGDPAQPNTLLLGLRSPGFTVSWNQDQGAAALHGVAAELAAAVKAAIDRAKGTRPKE
jgi:chromosome segregation ATPase